MPRERVIWLPLKCHRLPLTRDGAVAVLRAQLMNLGLLDQSREARELSVTTVGSQDLTA